MSASNNIIKEALKQFGEDYINQLRRELQQLRKVATGDLINSLDSKLIKTAFGTIYTIQILAEDYLINVDEGRKPGTYPNLKKIKKWMSIKNINPKATFPIMKKIKERGIKKTDVMEKTIKKMETGKPILSFKNNMFNYFDKIIEEMVININSNKNITIR